MALKSAKIAGLKVDGGAFQGAMNWLDKATSAAPMTYFEHPGCCAYAADTIAAVEPGKGSCAMTAAGMIMRLFMGTPRDDKLVMGAADLIKDNKYFQPTWPATSGRGIGYGPDNFYYWYYSTLGMFQVGGKHWEDWNKKVLKDILLPHQCKGGPLDGSAADKDGSWDPNGGGGVGEAGRVMSTAFGALCLEVYYRYLPLYVK
jgi:hypothetical protein